MFNSYELYILKMRCRHIVNYSYIIVNKISRKAALVDPAWQLDKITDWIDRLQIDLTAILLTHSHIDHTNLVKPLLKIYSPKVYMSQQESEYYDFKCNNLITIGDMDIIELGNTPILSMLSPGHTRGGICYLLKDTIFTGDTIFIEGCGMCDTVGGSAEDMYESIQKIKRFVDPEVRVYPGHSFGRKPGDKLEFLIDNNVYFSINDKEKFVKFRMRKNQRNLFNFK